MKKHSIKGLYTRYRRTNTSESEFPTGISQLDSLLSPRRGDVILITSETRVDGRSLVLSFALQAVASGKTVDIICGCFEEDRVFEVLLGKMANVRTECITRSTIPEGDLDQAAGDLLCICNNNLRIISSDSGRNQSIEIIDYFSGDDVADVVCILSIDHAMYDNKSSDEELYMKGYGNKTLFLNNIQTKAFMNGVLVFATLKTSLDNIPILINQEQYGRIREIANAIISIKRPGTYFDEKNMTEDAQLIISHSNIGPTETINVARSYSGEFYEPFISTMLS